MREKEHIRHSHHRIYSLCNKGMILNGRIAPQKYIFEISRTCRRLLGSSHHISHISGKYTIVQFSDLMIPRYESTTTFSVFLRVLTIPILRIFDRFQRNQSCSAPIRTCFLSSSSSGLNKSLCSKTGPALISPLAFNAFCSSPHVKATEHATLSLGRALM